MMSSGNATEPQAHRVPPAIAAHIHNAQAALRGIEAGGPTAGALATAEVGPPSRLKPVPLIVRLSW